MQLSAAPASSLATLLSADPLAAPAATTALGGLISQSPAGTSLFAQLLAPTAPMAALIDIAPTAAVLPAPASAPPAAAGDIAAVLAAPATPAVPADAPSADQPSDDAELFALLATLSAPPLAAAPIEPSVTEATASMPAIAPAAPAAFAPLPSSVLVAPAAALSAEPQVTSTLAPSPAPSPAPTHLSTATAPSVPPVAPIAAAPVHAAAAPVAKDAVAGSPLVATTPAHTPSVLAAEPAAPSDPASLVMAAVAANPGETRPLPRTPARAVMPATLSAAAPAPAMPAADPAAPAPTMSLDAVETPIAPAPAALPGARSEPSAAVPAQPDAATAMALLTPIQATASVNSSAPAQVSEPAAVTPPVSAPSAPIAHAATQHAVAGIAPTSQPVAAPAAAEAQRADRQLSLDSQPTIASEPPAATANTRSEAPFSVLRSEAAAPSAPRSEPNPLDRAVAHQVARSIVQHLPDGGTRLVMRLTPPELGTVRIEFLTRDGIMTARLVAEDDGVRQALDRALPHIRAEVRGDHPSLDITIDRSEQRQAWSDSQARQERRDDPRAGRDRRRHDDGATFSIDGVEAAPSALPMRAAPVLGGRVTSATVDALA